MDWMFKLEQESKFFRFAERTTTEYASIFPRPLELLSHLLFVSGNGYGFNDRTGMFVCGETGYQIDKFPALTKEEEKEFIDRTIKKEEESIQRYAKFVDAKIIDKQLAEAKKIKMRSFSILDFQEDDLYEDFFRVKKDDPAEFVRPYPMYKGTTSIYKLNNKTPKWFVGIALNLCNAWIRFLNEELATGHVWDAKIHGNEKVTTDRADLKTTTEQRDAIVERVQFLQKLMDKK